MKEEIKIVDRNCVNSKHVARFLSQGNEEWCQCSFGACKIRVSVETNGCKPYTYILTETEYEASKTIIKQRQPHTKIRS